MKTCEICGQQKSSDAFSKAYTHRCKDCVNKATRAKRLLEKEEYKPKLTIPIPPIDWEQRRYEVAKSVLNGLIANANYMNGLVKGAIKNGMSDEEIEKYIREDLSSTAIDITDALIEKLK